MNLIRFRKELPDTVPTERVFQWWDYLLFLILSGLSISAIVYFASYWLTVNAWHSSSIILAIMTFILSIILINTQGRWFLLPFMRRPNPIRAMPGWKVGVATTFVEGAESLEMLHETLRGLLALDYPHDTWVLDEGNDDRVKALCRRLGVHHFSRKNLPHYQTPGGLFQSHSKHGNYNAWLFEIGFDRYEIITAFDPDHVPDPAFLSQVLGYFEHPNVGYVQAAQAYYNQNASFIARGAAEETYAYYSSIQMAGYGMGYPIVIGCHNTHRVAALRQVSGFAPHDADDLLITLRYRSSGWQGIYIPKILARGLTPVDWNGYLAQQRRWARSILDLKIRFYPKLAGKLPVKTRAIGFAHGLNYLHKSLLIPIGLLLLTFMLATGTAPSGVFTEPALWRLGVLVGALQLCEFYRQRFYLDWKVEWGVHWRAGLLQLAKWPYLLSALFDVLVGHRPPYVLTPKTKLTAKPRMMMWPQIGVVAVISTAWIIGMMSGMSNPIIHLCAGSIVASSLALILTERWIFPDPYPKSGMGYASPPLRRASLPEAP